eukprot:scaffold6205_cov92-Cylindrotheca_fusiformis.AAC.3
MRDDENGKAMSNRASTSSLNHRQQQYRDDDDVIKLDATTATATADYDGIQNDGLMRMSTSSTIPSSTSSTSSSFLTPVIWCILLCEAAERFAYFGFRAILVLYFTNALQFSESTAISLFAYVASLAYLSPLLGAILADGSWGRYRTITRFGSIYLIGLCVLTFAALFLSPTNTSSSARPEKQEITTNDHDDAEDEDDMLYWKRIVTCIGLVLICLGTGGIKPCVSAFGADQVVSQTTTTTTTLHHCHPRGNEGISDECTTSAIEEDIAEEECPTTTSNTSNTSSSRELQAFFAYFYFCINLGALASIFLVPILKAHYGFGIAFLAPTIFLFLALGAFWSKRAEYVHHDVSNDNDDNESSGLLDMFRLCGILIVRRIRNWWRHHSVTNYYENLQTHHGPGRHQISLDDGHHHDQTWTAQQLEDAATTLQVLPVLSMLPIFWMLYDQQGSVWTLQATRMELSLGIEPEQMNIINPVEILLFIPLFDRIIYPAIERLQGNGRPFSHLSRMACGMFLCAVSFFVSAILEAHIQRQEQNGFPNSVSIFWQLPQITILSIAEIFLSVTGYDFCYSNSPAGCKTLVLSLFLVTTAVGDFLAGILYNLIFKDWNRVSVLYTCGGLMLLNLVVFVCVIAQWWNQCQEEKEKSNISSSIAVLEESNHVNDNGSFVLVGDESNNNNVDTTSCVEEDNGMELMPSQ